MMRRTVGLPVVALCRTLSTTAILLSDHHHRQQHKRHHSKDRYHTQQRDHGRSTRPLVHEVHDDTFDSSATDSHQRAPRHHGISSGRGEHRKDPNRRKRFTADMAASDVADAYVPAVFIARRFVGPACELVEAYRTTNADTKEEEYHPIPSPYLDDDGPAPDPADAPPLRLLVTGPLVAPLDVVKVKATDLRLAIAAQRTHWASTASTTSTAPVDGAAGKSTTSNRRVEYIHIPMQAIGEIMHHGSLNDWASISAAGHAAHLKCPVRSQCGLCPMQHVVPTELAELKSSRLAKTLAASGDCVGRLVSSTGDEIRLPASCRAPVDSDSAPIEILEEDGHGDEHGAAGATTTEVEDTVVLDPLHPTNGQLRYGARSMHYTFTSTARRGHSSEDGAVWSLRLAAPPSTKAEADRAALVKARARAGGSEMDLVSNLRSVLGREILGTTDYPTKMGRYRVPAPPSPSTDAAAASLDPLAVPPLSSSSEQQQRPLTACVVAPKATTAFASAIESWWQRLPHTTRSAFVSLDVATSGSGARDDPTGVSPPAVFICLTVRGKGAGDHALRDLSDATSVQSVREVEFTQLANRAFPAALQLRVDLRVVDAVAGVKPVARVFLLGSGAAVVDTVDVPNLTSDSGPPTVPAYDLRTTVANGQSIAGAERFHCSVALTATATLALLCPQKEDLVVQFPAAGGRLPFALSHSAGCVVGIDQYTFAVNRCKETAADRGVANVVFAEPKHMMRPIGGAPKTDGHPDAATDRNSPAKNDTLAKTLVKASPPSSDLLFVWHVMTGDAALPAEVAASLRFMARGFEERHQYAVKVQRRALRDDVAKAQDAVGAVLHDRPRDGGRARREAVAALRTAKAKLVALPSIVPGSRSLVRVALVIDNGEWAVDPFVSQLNAVVTDLMAPPKHNKSRGGDGRGRDHEAPRAGGASVGFHVASAVCVDTDPAGTTFSSVVLLELRARSGDLTSPSPSN